MSEKIAFKANLKLNLYDKYLGENYSPKEIHS